jgi:hypothetical protein
VIERLGDEPVLRRSLYAARLERLDDWPEAIDEPPPHFVAFLALDPAGVADEVLIRFADKLLDQGAAYICAWGPDCERVHDRVDDARAAGVSVADDDAVVPTTWHAGEPLDQALWFALYAACPHDRYIETCGSLLAVVSGPDEWEEQVRRRLSNPRQLMTDVAL